MADVLCATAPTGFMLRIADQDFGLAAAWAAAQIDRRATRKIGYR